MGLYHMRIVGRKGGVLPTRRSGAAHHDEDALRGELAGQAHDG